MSRIIAKKISNKYKIKFKYLQTKEYTPNINNLKKHLNFFNKNETIIIDTNCSLWKKDYMFDICIKNFYLNDNNFPDLIYNSNMINNWKFLKIIRKPYNNKNNFYYIENKQSIKFNFIYLSNVIYNLYKIIKIYKISSNYSIQIYKLSVFNNLLFDLSLIRRHNFDDLKNIIVTLGGMVSNKSKYDFDKNVNYLIVDINNIDELTLNQKVNNCPNAKVVNERYLYDSFFFMTKMDEEDNEYKIKI